MTPAGVGHRSTCRRLSFRGRGRFRGGITLVEVMLGLVITAMVASATFTMLFSVDRGTRSQEDRRQVIMRRFLLSNRLSSVVRSSDRVLAAGADYLVFWRGDVDGNGKPNLAEIQRVEWVSAEARIWSYAAPSTLAPASNTTYNLTDDFATITATLAGGATFPGQIWGTGVTDFAIELDNATVQSAKIVQLEMILNSGSATGELTVTNRLRQVSL